MPINPNLINLQPISAQTQVPSGLGNDFLLGERSGAFIALSMDVIRNYVLSSVSSGFNFDFGNTLPANSVGNPGDVFLLISDGKIYEKDALVWTEKFDIPTTGEVNALIAAAITTATTGLITQTQADARYLRLSDLPSPGGLPFNLIDTTTGTPALEQIRANSATLSSITQWNFSKTGRLNTPLATVQDLFAVGTILRIVLENNEDVSAWFRISQAITDQSTYRTIPVTFVGAPSGVTTLSHLTGGVTTGTNVEVSVQFYGAAGTSGGGGATGLRFTWSSTLYAGNTTNATTGQIRVSSSTPVSATALSISVVEQQAGQLGATDLAGVLGQMLKNGKYIAITKDATNRYVYKLTSDFVANANGNGSWDGTASAAGTIITGTIANGDTVFLSSLVEPVTTSSSAIATTTGVNPNTPAVASTATYNVDTSAGLSINAYYAISGISGTFVLTAIPSSTSITLQNVDAAVNATVASGTRITPTGQRGATGAPGTVSATSALGLTPVSAPPAASATEELLYVLSTDGKTYKRRRTGDGGVIVEVGAGSGSGRIFLTANRTYYVRTTGTRTTFTQETDATTNVDADAFGTIANAINAIKKIDANGFVPNISIGAGTFTEVVNLPTVVGTDFAAITGAGTSSTTVTFDGALTSALTHGVFQAISCKTIWTLSGFKITTTVNDRSAILLKDSTLNFQSIQFDSHYFDANVLDGGILEATGNYSFSRNKGRHLSAEGSGVIRIQQRTITIIGTPSFVQGCVYIAYGSPTAILNLNTFVGSATGQRYYVGYGGRIIASTGATYLPGSTAGLQDIQGFYNEF